jgi:predicted RNA-binding Zn-ribbon protein involved in translation (DUF1610 family)
MKIIERIDAYLNEGKTVNIKCSECGKSYARDTRDDNECPACGSYKGNELSESFSEGDNVIYQGKTWEVLEKDNGMLILVLPDGKERVKVLAGEVKKMNESVNEGMEGVRFKCVSAGRIEIISGTDARSADARVGDTFTVTRDTTNWYEGKLTIVDSFSHDPGLSGKKVSGYVGHSGVIFALRKNKVTDTEDDFWATWKQV